MIYIQLTAAAIPFPKEVPDIEDYAASTVHSLCGKIRSCASVIQDSVVRV